MLSRVLRRQFSLSRRLLDALVFKMPAMSPTMTEGGIVNWKVAPGDHFAAGDVLLEVETDKATIDVEASDDGQMFEILQNDGAKGIPVGEPIAFLAEPEDDLKSLAKPPIEHVAKEAIPKHQQPPDQATKTKLALALVPSLSLAASQSSSSPKVDKDASKVVRKANPNQTLLPSVVSLLLQNNITQKEALDLIPATGPNGRILKGDVLAYLGKIPQDAPAAIAEYVALKEHLDLSNVVPAQPKDAAKGDDAAAAATKDGKAADATLAPRAPKPLNKLRFSFRAKLGESSPAEFEYQVSAAINKAKVVAYSTEFPEYVTFGPLGAIPASSDAIFDELMVPAATVDRFKVEQVSINFIKATEVAAAARAAPVSLFDELLLSPVATRMAPLLVATEAAAKVSFTIQFDDKLIDSKKLVDAFANSVIDQVVASDVIVEQLMA